VIVLLLASLAIDCAPCHKEIAANFARTPMANSSGRVTQLPAARYIHSPSQTQYDISSTGRVAIATPEARATQQLNYFIGSGAHGRSFLFLRNQKLYEAPITHYAHKGWGPSPGYEKDKNSDWTRQITKDCLWCHTTGTEPQGLSCERCHAPDEKHFNKPTSLAVEARSDVCRQCHQLANRRDLPGKSFFDFKPGMRLDDLVRYETKPIQIETPLSTTSHFERLAESACAKSSGDKLWCGTCHSPHSSKAQDPNQSCRNCHVQNQCGRGVECAACHMPKNTAPDSSHAVFTDHWIRKRP
jgi:hypothetical protein